MQLLDKQWQQQYLASFTSPLRQPCPLWYEFTQSSQRVRRENDHRYVALLFEPLCDPGFFFALMIRYQNIQDAFMRVVISVERKVGSSVVVAMGRQPHGTAPLRLRSSRGCVR